MLPARLLAGVFVCLASGVLGCHSGWRTESRYETIQVSPQRDADQARRKNQAAAKHLEREQLEKAEAELQAALIADVEFGPAHNNLGYVYYLQEKYYLAAWEFEYAQRLMPDSPEPVNNLGLVYEAVSRYPQAQEMFELASQMAPDQPEYLGNLVRVRLKRNERSAELAEYLRTVALQDDRPEWRNWALEELHTTLREYHFDLDPGPVEAPPDRTQAVRMKVDAEGPEIALPPEPLPPPAEADTPPE